MQCSGSQDTVVPAVRTQRPERARGAEAAVRGSGSGSKNKQDQDGRATWAVAMGWVHGMAAWTCRTAPHVVATGGPVVVVSGLS